MLFFLVQGGHQGIQSGSRLHLRSFRAGRLGCRGEDGIGKGGHVALVFLPLQPAQVDEGFRERVVLSDRIDVDRGLHFLKRGRFIAFLELPGRLHIKEQGSEGGGGLLVQGFFGAVGFSAEQVAEEKFEIGQVVVAVLLHEDQEALVAFLVVFLEEGHFGEIEQGKEEFGIEFDGLLEGLLRLGIFELFGVDGSAEIVAGGDIGLDLVRFVQQDEGRVVIALLENLDAFLINFLIFLGHLGTVLG